MARASAAQRRHEEKHGGPDSPLADLRYSSIENRLWRWVDSPVDTRIEPVVTDFAALGEAARSSLRDSLSMDDFYTLFAFARRRALAFLRGSEARQIQPAFVSLAMIDLERVDWRDLLMANSLVCYAGERIGAPVADLVSRTIQLSERKTAEALMRQRTTRTDLAQSCGYREVRTSEGVALFDTRYEHFSPQADLERIAFESAVALENNGYEIGDIYLASDLPLTWLDGRGGSAIAKMARSLSGCVAIHGLPLADPAPMSSGQSILFFWGKRPAKVMRTRSQPPPKMPQTRKSPSLDWRRVEYSRLSFSIPGWRIRRPWKTCIRWNDCVPSSNPCSTNVRNGSHSDTRLAASLRRMLPRR